MKKKFLLISIIFIVVLVIFTWINKPVTDVSEVYLIPEEYQGCVWIYYNQPKAKPLVIENKEIIYQIPENGILNTSSPSDFGNLGWHDVKAFYVNDQGQRVQEVPHEDYKLGGSYSNGSPLSERFWVKFKTNITNEDVCK